ncbi:MAG TPA: tRNA lysidine(34) synthetase TilS [Candidatus Sulfotelmatobacter sp.]|nr:tRNA lysidine(34) synthetase TilS [Candidatus Sulfotelmatobacter sp.]
MYHVFVHSLAQRVLEPLRQQDLLSAGQRVGVAVSGGIDSVALLRLLLELRGELGIVLSVVHFNHKLRGAEAEADEKFVSDLAREHDLEFFADSDDVVGHAKEEGVSLETAARRLRYGFFRHVIGEASEVKSPTLSQNTREGWGNPAISDVEVPTSRKPDETWGTPRGRISLRARLDKICTGHTLDDQAETVLMRMIRGTGLRGMGGIYPRLAVEEEDGEFCGEIVRPLLAFRRRELEHYLRDIGQVWREDATNLDPKFTRNRVRKLLVPLLEKEFNPAVAENLAELAEIARGEEDYWENEVAGWMGTGVHWSEPEWARTPERKGLVQIGSVMQLEKSPISRAQDARETEYRELQAKIERVPWLVMNASVDRLWFLGEPVAVQRRVVKAIGEQAGIPLEFKHVEEVLRFAAEETGSGKEVSLPLGWKVVREPHELLFVTPDLREPAPDQDYEYELPVPGEVSISETGSCIEVRRVAAGGEAYNPEHLLDADSLPGRLKVRNWRAGDRFWPAHTKSPKKVKELLQERHVAQPERRLWPVVVSGDEIVWMRGFALPARFQAKPGREGWLISERQN